MNPIFHNSNVNMLQEILIQHFSLEKTNTSFILELTWFCFVGAVCQMQNFKIFWWDKFGKRICIPPSETNECEIRSLRDQSITIPYSVIIFVVTQFIATFCWKDWFRNYLDNTQSQILTSYSKSDTLNFWKPENKLSEN